MNNRITKFRGKSVVNGEWAYGLPKYGSGGNINYICGWMGEDDNPLYNEVEVDPKTITEFTGLKNKSGTEVYENDIYQTETYKGVIEYNTEIAAYILRRANKTFVRLDVIKDKIEVLGNIFEHPHLIEKT